MKIVAYKKLVHNTVRLELHNGKKAIAIFDVPYKNKKKNLTADEYHAELNLSDIINLHRILGEYLNAKENVGS